LLLDKLPTIATMYSEEQHCLHTICTFGQLGEMMLPKAIDYFCQNMQKQQSTKCFGCLDMALHTFRLRKQGSSCQAHDERFMELREGSYCKDWRRSWTVLHIGYLASLTTGLHMHPSNCKA